MTLFVTLFALLLCAFTVRRSGLISPLSVFSVIAAANLIVLVQYRYLGWMAQSMSGWWHMAAAQRDAAVPASLVLLAVVAIAAALCLFVSPARLPTLQTGRLSTMVTRLQRPVFAAVALVFVMSLIHAVDLDWSSIWSHRTYLFTRQPANVGLDNPVTAVLHRLYRLPLILVAFAGGFFLRRRPGPALLATATAAYWAVISLGGASQFTTMIVAVWIAGLFAASAKRRVLIAAVGGLVVIQTNALVLDLRNEPQIGLSQVGRLIADGGGEEDLAFKTPRAYFGGGMVLSEAIAEDNVSYPLVYELLSISPTPSALDGFRAHAAAHQRRITITAPYSGLAEIVHFSPAGKIVVIVFLAGAVLLSHRFIRLNNVTGLIASIPLYLGIGYFFLYPLRNGVRFVYLTLFIMLAVWAFNRLRRRYRATGRAT